MVLLEIIQLCDRLRNTVRKLWATLSFTETVFSAVRSVQRRFGVLTSATTSRKLLITPRIVSAQFTVSLKNFPCVCNKFWP